MWRSPKGGGNSRGAGDENRTRVISLEGWGSATELHPRGWLGMISALCGHRLRHEDSGGRR